MKEFRGYEVRRDVSRTEVSGVSRRNGPPGSAVEDVMRLATPRGPEDIVLSKAPEPPLTEDEFEVLRSAILGPQAK